MGDGPSRGTVPPSAPEGILETKGCGHESEKPCSRLLSADTFGAAPRAKTPGCICYNYALSSRPGDSQWLGASWPLVLRDHWRGPAMHDPFGWPPTNRRSDAAEGLLPYLGQQEGRDHRGNRRGDRTCELPWRTGRTARAPRPPV